MADAPEIARINALTTNARNTWFILLGTLVFIAITLMGVEHFDFYGAGRDTKLPLVDVSVPTRYFFYAAPILTAAIYGYFQLYLIRLWGALGAAPARIGELRLGEVVSPWLVTDAALHLRCRIRDDTCVAERPLDGLSMTLNLALAMAFGVLILGWLWWASMPARDATMTLCAAVALSAALVTGATSFAALLQSMRHPKGEVRRPLWQSAPALSAVLVAALTSFPMSIQRTTGSPEFLAPLNLTEARFTPRPGGWLPCAYARREALSGFAAREELKDTQFDDWSDSDKARFTAEWRVRRAGQIAAIDKLDLSRADFRNTDLTGAFGLNLSLPPFPWPGATLSPEIFEGTAFYDSAECSFSFSNQDLSGVELARMDFSEAQLHSAEMSGVTAREGIFRGAELSFSNLSGGDYYRASFVGADLSSAVLIDADLTWARLHGAQATRANFNGAGMRLARLQNAVLEDASFVRANLTDSDMTDASLDGADLTESTLADATAVNASFSGATLLRTDMRQTDFTKANFILARIAGTVERPIELSASRFAEAQFQGASLRFVDLRAVASGAFPDLENSFGDASVRLPAGMEPPCQWSGDVLDDEAFMGRWRAWLELYLGADEGHETTTWSLFGPPDFQHVAAIPPPVGCAWIGEP